MHPTRLPWITLLSLPTASNRGCPCPQPVALLSLPNHFKSHVSLPCSNPEYRQQLEGMLQQQVASAGSPAMAEMMQGMDMSPEKVVYCTARVVNAFGCWLLWLR